MGTKKEFIELQEILKDEVHSYPLHSREWKVSNRRLKISEILNDLGFLPVYNDELDDIAVEYRNRKYSCDIIRENILSLFSVIAHFDQDALNEEEALAVADIIHEVNAFEVIGKVYLIGGEVVVSSEQYLGKRDIEEDEVAYILNSMDHVARSFWGYVKVNELIKEYMVCR